MLRKSASPILAQKSSVPFGKLTTAPHFKKQKWDRTFLGSYIALLLTLFLLAGCLEPPANSAQSAVAPSPKVNSRITTDISDLDLADISSPEASKAIAVVDTGNQRANVRSGPGSEFPIVAKANPDTRLQIVAQNEEGNWWQICCVNGLEETEEDDPTTLAWLADSVIEIEGDTDSVPVFGAILPEALESAWEVEWNCGSERCEIRECSADVTATVGSVVSQQWLQVDHEVTWSETCFSTDQWVFEVNRFSGDERTNRGDDNFLYSYWIGPKTGETNSLYKLDDGRQVAAFCSDEQEVEVEEGEGWATVYTGTTCHDVKTGMLLALSYEKRWLFTGEFEGQTYEREYFGDFELLDQNLTETNAELLFVDQ